MEPIIIEGTPKTPSVSFNAKEGILDIKGRSIPENSIEFYKPLVDWLEQYSGNPAAKTKVNIHLEYFNTSSSKCILDVFKKLEAMGAGGGPAFLSTHPSPSDRVVAIQQEAIRIGCDTTYFAPASYNTFRNSLP